MKLHSCGFCSDGGVLFGNGGGGVGTELIQLSGKLIIGNSQDGNGQVSGVLGTVQGNRGNREAGRHLHGSKQSIQTVHGTALHRDADHRQSGVGGKGTCQVGRHTGSAQDNTVTIGAGRFGKGSGGSTVQKIDRPAVESAELQFAHPAAGDTIAVFDTSAGVFKAVLFPDKAPQAYDNFAGLVQAGYYNGLTFSRVESGFVVEAGQGADGRGSTIWNGSRYPAETTDSLHHYSGALCMGTDASGECASVFYVMQTLPGDQSVTQELVDQMNSAGYRAEVVSAYQTAGGAPYLDYTDTVLGQVYEGMDVVDAIGQTAVDEIQKPREDITINSVSITQYE